MEQLTPLITKAGRDQALALLPNGWNDSERKRMVFSKVPHRIGTVENLLVLILLYAGNGWTLRKAAHWAEENELGEISNVAFLKWLKKAGAWLEWIGMQLLREQRESMGDQGLFPRAVDGSVVPLAQHKGKHRKRLHLEIDLRSGLMANCLLSGYKKGESLSHFEKGSGNRILIADRGFSSRKQVLNTIEQNDHVLVRLALNKKFLLVDKSGKPLDLTALLHSNEKVGEAKEYPAFLEKKSGQPSVAGRLIILKKDDSSSQWEHARQKESARKQNRSFSENAQLACQYMILWTSLPQDDLDKEAVLQLYRQRWQVEWLVRRLKSEIGINDIRHRMPETAQTWLWAKIILAILTEKLGRLSGAFPPAQFAD